jgi:hypothetical protein
MDLRLQVQSDPGFQRRGEEPLDDDGVFVRLGLEVIDLFDELYR